MYLLKGFSACEVSIVAEDYGQGIALPHYGFRRPGSDYFNSNLMMHLYVMADITRGEHNVVIYDERLMGKDRDALCSLRMAQHIAERNRCLENDIVPPKYSIRIRDNCVGQNKSNAVLKLECFLSMSFYERVLVIYLIPGHSHMLPDRVVSWVKKTLNIRNVYSPEEIIDCMETVRGVAPTFLDHRDPNRAAYTGWAPLLDKYIKNLPALFTKNYIFEFYNGKVRMQYLMDTDISEASEITLCANPESASRALKLELFGTSSVGNLDPTALHLPRAEIVALPATKIKSLSNKYDTIPQKFLPYFPSADLGGDDDDDDDENASQEDGAPAKKAKPKSTPVQKKAKKTAGLQPAGRPKKFKAPDSEQKSIINFFTRTTSASSADRGGGSSSSNSA